MNSESPVSDYQQACRRYLEVQSVTDIHKRDEQSLQLRHQFQKAFARLLVNADFSGTEVWHALGDAYSKGWGTTADKKQAFKWFHRAADAGHTKSMVRLGLMLQSPPPTGDPVKSIQWLSRAAERGDASGMCFLGFAFREGKGVTCDMQKAVDWFIKAVEAGDKHSMIHVGRMYSRHLKRPDEAIRWFLRAAEAEQTESHLELAFLYEDRKSPLYDAVQAVNWYHRVASGTSDSKDRARIALAHFCRNGEGTPHDIAQGKGWLRKVLQSAPPTSALHREAKTLLASWELEML